ncbi:hypothetical protein KFK09_013446 [Dendrobium nobile]|uniref:Uncharacterized protein n=1 Tax=Dendrobium nobile TaxID=94219 RepID=A0A8T3B8S6_DENNO|nr:hypothetical protein KFK09_013446 [Dendrobium nobile]
MLIDHIVAILRVRQEVPLRSRCRALTLASEGHPQKSCPSPASCLSSAASASKENLPLVFGFRISILRVLDLFSLANSAKETCRFRQG